MNKIIFNISNALQYSKFVGFYPAKKIEYPDILAFLNKKYGKPIFADYFLNLDYWQITDRIHWGSVRPGNLCTFVKENVALKTVHGNNSLVISTTGEAATGKDWQGNDVPRPISSGLITSKFLLKPGRVLSATVDASNSYPGSWFSFWLLKKDYPGDDRYREVDIFEKFMQKPGQKKYSVSIHGGTRNSREMMSFSFPLFMVNEKKVTFTCELELYYIKIFVNGILLCIAEEPEFAGEYYIMLNDGPSTHNGKVKEEEILKYLPRTFEVIDFRIYNR